MNDLERQRQINAQFERLAELCSNNPELKDRTLQYLNGELRGDTMRNLTIRLPNQLIERVEKLLENEQFILRYGDVKRADVIRECLVRGIQLVEKEASTKMNDRKLYNDFIAWAERNEYDLFGEGSFYRALSDYAEEYDKEERQGIIDTIVKEKEDTTND